MQMEEDAQQLSEVVVTALGISKEDLMPPQVEKEGADLDPMP